MKELKTWFEVFDFFGGDTTLFYESYYEDAVKIAEKRGCTFSKELYQQTCQTVLMP